MPAGDWIWYGKALEGQFGTTGSRRVDYVNDPLKVLLTTVTHTPDQDIHDFRNDITGEVASGGGYTTGGVAVTGKSVAYDPASNELRIVFADNVWGPGATITFRNVHLYKDTGSSATDPLLAYIAYAGDQAVINGTLTIDNNPTATLKITAAT